MGIATSECRQPASACANCDSHDLDPSCKSCVANPFVPLLPSSSSVSQSSQNVISIISSLDHAEVIDSAEYESWVSGNANGAQEAEINGVIWQVGEEVAVFDLDGHTTAFIISVTDGIIQLSLTRGGEKLTATNDQGEQVGIEFEKLGDQGAVSADSLLRVSSSSLLCRQRRKLSTILSEGTCESSYQGRYWVDQGI